MKRTLFILAAAGTMAMAQASLPSHPPTDGNLKGVVGSVHDLSYNGGGSSSTGKGVGVAYANDTEVCIFCHNPHGQTGTAQAIPLWNHATTTTTFVMYGSVNSLANPNSELLNAIDNSPSGQSLACLSCHDGTLSLAAGYSGVISSLNPNASVAYAATNTTGSVIGGLKYATVGAPVAGLGDLTSVHPIGVVYNTTVDSGLRLPVGQYVNGLAKLFGGGPVSLAAPSGILKVQCASCHDVHNWTGATGVSSGYFLRDTMNGSQLCLDCHINK